MSYVDDLVRRKPEIRPFSQYITNNLADNYCKGLNGSYANRLNEGIRVATQAQENQLSRIIQELISDRTAKNAVTKVTSIEANRLSEEAKRALILALWSVRIPKITRDGKIEIENTAVYPGKNHTPPPKDYMPPVRLSNQSPSVTPSTDKNGGYEPNLAEIENILKKLSRKGGYGE